jgi:hypothetical protein
MKYKIEITEGCIAYGMTVNGKNIGGDYEPTRMSEQEVDEMIDYLIGKVREGINDQTILLEDLIRLFQYDSCEHDDEPCDQCGDYVSTTRWEI